MTGLRTFQIFAEASSTDITGPKRAFAQLAARVRSSLALPIAAAARRRMTGSGE
jgi:hypothetical protein